jgi:flagellar biosynthesis protein FlhG
VDSPTSKSARNLERIARRVLALLGSADAGEAAPRAPGAPTNHYETLGMTRGASDEEIRRAYKRQRDLFAPGSLALTSLVYGDELGREQARIEEAHETLLDPVRRRSYDLTTFPEAEAREEPPRRLFDEGLLAELSMLQAELAREIGPDTEFTGALLRKVREAHGIELADVAQRPKIGASHFRAIEDEAYADLPALVYTRGFLQELAKFLKLDPAQVSRTYLRRMREALAASGRPLS